VQKWFVKDKGGEELWEANLIINANRSFKHFGLLHRKKNMYLAFNSKKEGGVEMQKHNFPEKSSTMHGRNN
jgi:hypothetical protein